MPLALPYKLPAMLGSQYMLCSVLDETDDMITYAAMQNDIRRDVIIVSLRLSAMQDAAKVALFLETARMKVRMSFKVLGVVLELLFINDAWHLVNERIKGEPLDMILAAGHCLHPLRMADLLHSLCYACVYLDIERLACIPFDLRCCYAHSESLRMENPVIAGERSRDATAFYLKMAAAELMPLLDMDASTSTKLHDIMTRMAYMKHWETLSAMIFAEELWQLQVESAH